MLSENHCVNAKRIVIDRWTSSRLCSLNNTIDLKRDKFSWVNIWTQTRDDYVWFGVWEGWGDM